MRILGPYKWKRTRDLTPRQQRAMFVGDTATKRNYKFILVCTCGKMM